MVKKAYSVETKLACIGMMNCTVSTNLWGNNIPTVKEWNSYLKWNNYAYRWNC